MYIKVSVNMRKAMKVEAAKMGTNVNSLTRWLYADWLERKGIELDKEDK
jgi:uncharacterized protein YabE (DUF348 family)